MADRTPRVEWSGMMEAMTETADEAIRNAHAWFEVNSGWAPPDPATIAEWSADGVCRCPDECLVTPEGWCEHGLASWCLILEALHEEDVEGERRRRTWRP